MVIDAEPSKKSFMELLAEEEEIRQTLKSVHSHYQNKGYNMRLEADLFLVRREIDKLS